jgi:tetratricopeptide (TPR) repeat protein
MARREPGRAADLHDQAIAETARGRNAIARRLLRRALRSGPDPARRAHILISLAYHEAERRSLADGLELLREADAAPGLTRRLRGLVASQRGLIYMRAGAASEAIEALGEALRLLDESQPQDVCRALLNRGILVMQRGRYADARADFARCAELARRHGLDLLAAKASHNLGYLWSLYGDLPRALREMDAVASILSGQSPVYAAVYHLDRAQVLLAAGLFREADQDLAHAVDLFRAGGVRQDQAEAELARAQVALLEGRWLAARTLAGRARRRFVGRGSDGWALLAGYASVAARVGEGAGLTAAAAEAAALADRLVAAGLADEARRARLTAAQAVLASRSRDPGRAAEMLAGHATRLHRSDPLATRLQARAVRALLAEARGEPVDADRERRAALADLHRYQAAFGSVDLQTAVSAHGHRLAADGLAAALTDGRPALVFQWAERARALSARLPPVLPPADEEAAALLEELRHARVELRTQTLSGQVDPALRTRSTRLEQRIRQRSWYAPGPGTTVAPATLARLRERLAAAGGGFVAHLLSGDRLFALVVTGRRQAVRELGPAAPALEAHRRLRHDLDALALDHLPDQLRAGVRAASRSALWRLDALLWQPIRDLAGEGPLLLAPAAVLSAVPWPLLPALRGRPVAVVASVTGWLHRRAALPATPAVAFATGPGVPRAADEVRLAAKPWSAAAPAAEATAAQVREAAATADVLHIAAHGVHEPDNPLFSYLDLADGPLFGHELNRIGRLPGHLVLSACELGLAGTRPGDETLGMTAALLHGGASSVVAGVARIADRVAYQVAPSYHAALCQGQAPAAALAAAIGPLDPETEPAPLVCFGAGW